MRRSTSTKTSQRRIWIAVCLVPLLAFVPVAQTSGADDPGPWGPEQEATIRPGVQISLEGRVCTSNFMFADADHYYLGTAAHCVGDDDMGARVHLSDDVVFFGSPGPAFGTVVYSSYHAMGISSQGPFHPHYNDLALIRIDPERLSSAHPSMKHFGGPVGQVHALEEFGFGDKLLAHGDTPMRPGPDQIDRLEGYVTGASAPWSVHAYFAPYSFPGDSGSGVITADGDAVGVIVSLATVPPAQVGISFLPPMLEFAADHGFPVQLVTWEQFDDGLLPEL